jgi:tetratricopeptide (TPR) repeat protein
MIGKYMGLFDFLSKIFKDPVEEENERILQDCNKALELNNKDPYLWNKKCLILIKLSKSLEAVEAGKIAVQLAPNDPELWNAFSSAYKLHGCPIAAERCQNIILDLKRKKKEEESQRLKSIGCKKCCSCGYYVMEIIKCGPCEGYFCPICWEKHQWSHGKAPAIGITYHSDGSFSGFDGSEKIKKDK